MLIGEFAHWTGVSARALRHYEDQGLLGPVRDTNGYRHYAASDVTVVEQIQAMITAGLGTSMIRRYLDCARTGVHGTSLELCPDLRSEIDRIAARLTQQQAALAATRQRLAELTGTQLATDERADTLG
ncbi:MerR family transcriptional regulator [Rhodococcus sp. MSC1_016]|uniref:MerR family transcriptional regulator n=1 Tax=Rhodococcus sp. MSC1_016 TaxID=2909266 RepID=UPI00202E7883|nr:MerR family transcriptional regulator [Rhodococcus sp. MSC1_016]